jgi:glycerate kinase
MRIVIAPDSFKGVMSAAEVCEVAAEAITEALPGAEAVKIPMADGGEGTLDAMLSSIGGKKVPHRVAGPEFTEIDSYYGQLNGGIAVVELAAICGLTMATERNPEKTTTFGVGQMIRKALDDGCKKIILCIGGSATNDAGAGAMAALGIRVTDRDGQDVKPDGAGLSKIAAIDASGMDARLRSTEILIACDVDNPLYGERGAAHVFAPQKGADRQMVARLDGGLRNYAALLPKDIALIPGTGAAGGIAASFIAFCGVVLRPGVEIVLNAVDFNERIEGADLLITGEGRTDAQTLGGKTVLGVARSAARQGVPVIVVSGDVDDDVDELLYKEGVLAVFSTNRLAKPFGEVSGKSADWLKATVRNVIRIGSLLCKHKAFP